MIVLAKTIKPKPIRPLHHASRRNNPLSVECDYYAAKQQQGNNNIVILGSDESGTGALAGPIVTATVTCIDPTAPNALLDAVVRDGKTLSLTERKIIFDQVMQHPLYLVSTAMRQADEIDQAKTIQHAVNEAFGESVANLMDRLTPLYPPQQDFLSIVDGKSSIPNLPISSRPWIKGDTTVYTVALASIVARVVRDEWIQTTAVKQYPHYKFDIHGGYPTAEHWHILHTFGPIAAVHRQSCKVVRQRRGGGGGGGGDDDTALHMMSRSSFLTVLVAAGTWTATGTNVEPANAMYTDKKTGIQYPEVGEIAAAIPPSYDANEIAEVQADKTRFQRLDSSSDAVFYQDPRFVEHVDASTVQRMADYLNQVVVKEPQVRAVLDLCSSWTSHLPNCSQHQLERVAGLGMNAEELQANPSLTEWVVADLNEKPVLPYSDESFDAVLCQLSIDYLTRPVEVCREIGRVLKKNGGTVHILFSNRLFLQKAVASWTGADDIDHAFTVGLYLQAAAAAASSFSWGQIRAQDLSERKAGKIVGDPLYVVTAVRAA